MLSAASATLPNTTITSLPTGTALQGSTSTFPSSTASCPTHAPKVPTCTEVILQKLEDLRNSISRDVRIWWQDTNRAYERLSVTQQLRQQASLALDLAQARYNLGLGSIVEFTQAELQKTEADIADTDATYQYRLTQIALAFAVATPK